MIDWGIVAFVLLLLFGPMLINNLRDAKAAKSENLKREDEMSAADRAEALREAIRRRPSDRRAA